MDLGAPNLLSDDSLGSLSATSDMAGVRALVLVGGRADQERFGEAPLALLDVLGRSLLLRTLDRIRAAGVLEIAVVSDTAPLAPGSASRCTKFSATSSECFWDEALQQFRQLGRQSECVLVLRLGAWAEVNFDAMVREHRASGAAITRVCSQRGEALDVFVISSSSQSEAAALLRGELRDERIAAAEHKTFGYVNLLTTPGHLRTLTLDAFAGESEIRPYGQELRPGIWLGKGTRVHRSARIVAPAFLGDFSNVRRAAVVTRGSSLEHHSEVDCGSVIDNSTILPYTRIGAGLDVEYSVVGFQQVHSLQREVTVDINDPHLIGATTTHLSARMFTTVSWLLTLLPEALWNTLFESRSEQMRQPAPDALASSTPALGEAPLATADAQTKSYREMAATRRYGNE